MWAQKIPTLWAQNHNDEKILVGQFANPADQVEPSRRNRAIKVRNVWLRRDYRGASPTRDARPDIFSPTQEPHPSRHPYFFQTAGTESFSRNLKKSSLRVVNQAEPSASLLNPTSGMINPTSTESIEMSFRGLKKGKLV